MELLQLFLPSVQTGAQSPPRLVHFVLLCLDLSEQVYDEAFETTRILGTGVSE